MSTSKKKAAPVQKKAQKKAAAPKPKKTGTISKPLQDKDLKKSGKFHQTVSRLAEDFQNRLSAAGYPHQLEQVAFAPEDDDLVCGPCGVETVRNPKTGKVITRCRQCPPPPPPVDQ